MLALLSCAQALLSDLHLACALHVFATAWSGAAATSARRPLAGARCTLALRS
jgi:hypothetical protein